MRKFTHTKITLEFNNNLIAASPLPKMARIYITAALIPTFCTLLLVVYLWLNFGEHEANPRLQWPSQAPVNSAIASIRVFEDESRYLLGVGKADITGQGSDRHALHLLLNMQDQAHC